MNGTPCSRIPQYRLIKYSLLWLVPCLIYAQSGITGSAPITLVSGPNDCGGACATVDIYVDVTGLSGTGGDAGLNAYVLVFDIDRPETFASVRAGTTPLNHWQLTSRNPTLVGSTQRFAIVGSTPDPNAPNQSYHVANLILCGDAGNVTLSLVVASSSLGSRLVSGEGPDAIDLLAPPLFTTLVPLDFELEWTIGVDSWRHSSPLYDLVMPFAEVDVLDLAKLVNCGLP